MRRRLSVIHRGGSLIHLIFFSFGDTKPILEFYQFHAVLLTLSDSVVLLYIKDLRDFFNLCLLSVQTSDDGSVSVFILSTSEITLLPTCGGVMLHIKYNYSVLLASLRYAVTTIRHEPIYTLWPLFFCRMNFNIS